MKSTLIFISLLGAINCAVVALDRDYCPTTLFYECTPYLDTNCREEIRGPDGEKLDDFVKLEYAKALNTKYSTVVD